MFVNFSIDEVITGEKYLPDDILDMEFNADGMELWLSCKDSHITVIDTKSWHVTKNVSPERYYIKSFLLLSPKFTQAVFRKRMTNVWIGLASTRELVFLLESPTESLIKINKFQPHKCRAIKRLTQSPDDKLLALILADGSLKIYSIEFLLHQIFHTFPAKNIAHGQTCLEQSHGFDTTNKKVYIKRN